MKDLGKVIGVRVQPSITPLGGQILRIWRVRSTANGRIRVEAAVANTDWTGFSGWVARPWEDSGVVNHVSNVQA